MRIEIRRNNTPAILITFNTHSERFDSNYERSKFFRELHGWEQVVPGNDKQYRYRRPGLLDEIPHKKVSDSVFIIAMEHMKRMESFFHQWEKKVEYDMMEIMMKQMDALKMKNTLTSGNTLNNARRRIHIE
ncbi:MAG: hypothetical protein HZB67_02545 [Candidatus Aenigmarchaeota archaeon]|nr:hypothetical protein [Candidatus Aenigmarchaeota archaeon]